MGSATRVLQLLNIALQAPWSNIYYDRNRKIIIIRAVFCRRVGGSLFRFVFGCVALFTLASFSKVQTGCPDCLKTTKECPEEWKESGLRGQCVIVGEEKRWKRRGKGPST